MDKNKEINALKSKNESIILKEKQDENSLRSSTDASDQNIMDMQKNDIISSLNKTTIKKHHHYYNKGNVYMFLLDKYSVPRIVIGPDCKLIKYIYL